jgi:hypothetical protein
VDSGEAAMAVFVCQGQRSSLGAEIGGFFGICFIAGKLLDHSNILISLLLLK